MYVGVQRIYTGAAVTTDTRTLKATRDPPSLSSDEAAMNLPLLDAKNFPFLLEVAAISECLVHDLHHAAFTEPPGKTDRIHGGSDGEGSQAGTPFLRERGTSSSPHRYTAFC